MFRLSQNLLAPLLRLVKLLSIMWLDGRVPVVARVLIFFAPLYWLCPFDLNPDFLPGGYADDLWIVPIAIVVAAKLIPLAVFYDARKAAAQAVCGIMCLSLTIMPSDHSAEQVKTSLPATISSSEALKIHNSQNAHASMAKCVAAATEPAAACLGIGQTGAVQLTCMRASYRENEQHLPFQRVRKVSRVRTSSFLLARGGQIQLYGTDGDAALAAAVLPEASLPRVKFCRLLAQAVFLSKNQSARERTQYSYKVKRSVAKAAC
jgi:uncharacterized membrane protein YkvA (DUF1232 family)